MKRILFIMLMCLPMVAVAQENATPKKVAVYVTSDDANIDNTTKSIIGGELVNAIVKTKKYQAVERTADFLKQITKEQGYQRSGNVDDGQISALGKQFGVDYVCVANVMPFKDKVYIQARLIDVETATVLAIAREISSISDIDEIMASSEVVANALVNPNEEHRRSSIKDNSVTSTELKVDANTKIYDVFAYGGGAGAYYAYRSKYAGIKVEYRIIYSSESETPEFQYLGTTPFAYCTEKTFDYLVLMLGNIPVAKKISPLIIENADDGAYVEFRLSKDGYQTVVIQPTVLPQIGGGMGMYIMLNKLKPLK